MPQCLIPPHLLQQLPPIAHVTFPAPSAAQQFTIVLHFSLQHSGSAAFVVVVVATGFVAAPVAGAVSAAHTTPIDPKTTINANTDFIIFNS
jgi:hypothetical protein